MKVLFFACTLFLSFSSVVEAQQLVTERLIEVSQSPQRFTEMRRNVIIPNTRGCNPASLRTNAAIRWMQNSGIFGIEPFSIINVRSAYVDFKEEDVILKILGEVEDDTTISLNKDEMSTAELQDITEEEQQQLRGSRIEMFAAPTTLRFIEHLGSQMWSELQLPLTVTALTTSPDRRTDDHCTHLAGHAFDLRPFPGGEARAVWWSKDKKVYDRAMNKKLLMYLLAQDEVKQVIFNDPHLHTDVDIKAVIAGRNSSTRPPVIFMKNLKRIPTANGSLPNTHHYHIHVETYVDEDLVAAAKEVVSVASRRRTTTVAVPKPVATTKVIRQ